MLFTCRVRHLKVLAQRSPLAHLSHLPGGTKSRQRAFKPQSSSQDGKIPKALCDWSCNLKSLSYSSLQDIDWAVLHCLVISFMR